MLSVVLRYSDLRRKICNLSHTSFAYRDFQLHDVPFAHANKCPRASLYSDCKSIIMK